MSTAASCYAIKQLCPSGESTVPSLEQGKNCHAEGDPKGFRLREQGHFFAGQCLMFYTFNRSQVVLNGICQIEHIKVLCPYTYIYIYTYIHIHMYSIYLGLNVPTSDPLSGLSIHYKGTWSLTAKYQT